MHDVCIICSSPGARASLVDAVIACGHSTEAFASARHAVARARDVDPPHCLVVDIDIDIDIDEPVADDGPTRDPAWCEALPGRVAPVPVVFVASAATTATAVRAMRGGAVDFLLRPFGDDELGQAIGEAHLREKTWRDEHQRAVLAAARYLRLTARERDVFHYLVQGLRTREIAEMLHGTESTVRVHRSRLMRKLGLGSVVEVIELAGRLR